MSLTYTSAYYSAFSEPVRLLTLKSDSKNAVICYKDQELGCIEGASPLNDALSAVLVSLRHGSCDDLLGEQNSNW